MMRAACLLLIAGSAAAQNMVCAFSHCGIPMVECVAEPQCQQAVKCLQACASDKNGTRDNRTPGCCYLCEMTYGYENPAFQKMLDCMGRNGCMEQYPDDGECLATDADAVQNITSMDQLEGDWWVIKGVNCGQLSTGADKMNPTPGKKFPGGYDWYPCQHERFVRSSGHDFPHPTTPWVNNITYCGGANGGLKECTTGIIDTVANVSLSAPGVVHHLYTDAPLLPQDEYWRVVSWPHPDYVFTVWCGHTPVVPYNGGITLSRAARSVEGMPPYVEANFRATAKRFGIDWDQMCPSSNEGCP